ncbi:hypothetical protein Pmar_PMAR021717 [Perkinsus marinus ATCC 50983]|uniref:Uncharacterized protein n=1 Tax=Perkinsus marinus (strain ATCC 50983 / TXsc) TaxID=423536 RepID=C5L2H3_PERM5|nr:hypothetical protein Pmar_PMAR021717 [Perkinsus marinus ATCC 50983]EER09067.1 hypothetical protein Pmar_PMAR021717 [Perkinsus marinus ATCC 50983]|eukprot:XP_002777251.1 hypothetical protein Pmar_PMAR021717 [Perkinsus marinus ATCC 50983]
MSTRDPLAVKECHNPLLPENTVRSLENASPKLPREVSDMFVGEAFQGYINVAVDSPKVNTLYDVTLKSLAVPSIHILQVQIRYALSPGGEALYFKRSYKFPVVAPLAVHHEAVQLDNRILCNISVTSSHPSAHIAIFGVGVEPIRGFLSEPVGDTSEWGAITKELLR